LQPQQYLRSLQIQLKLQIHITLTARRIFGSPFPSKASSTFGPTFATTRHLLGAPEQSTPCSGFTTAMECYWPQTTTRLPSILADIRWHQQSASPFPLVTIECALACAVEILQLTDFMEITTI
jgi:hypothetical protein